jgi:hypothetical protein
MVINNDKIIIPIKKDDNYNNEETDKKNKTDKTDKKNKTDKTTKADKNDRKKKKKEIDNINFSSDYNDEELEKEFEKYLK